MWVVYTLNSLYFAALLFLVSLGLNIILGVMGVLNLAHGGLYAVGAYMAAWLIIGLGAKLPVLLIITGLAGGLLLAGIVGWVIERTLIRAMYSRALEYQLLLTFGVLLLLEDLIKMVWGGQAYYASAPFDGVGQVVHPGPHLPGLFSPGHGCDPDYRHRHLAFHDQNPTGHHDAGHFFGPGNGHRPGIAGDPDQQLRLCAGFRPGRPGRGPGGAHHPGPFGHRHGAPDPLLYRRRRRRTGQHQRGRSRRPARGFHPLLWDCPVPGDRTAPLILNCRHHPGHQARRADGPRKEGR